jgi:hypothetical protein
MTSDDATIAAHSATQRAAEPSAGPARTQPTASVRARIGGYAVDMVILSAITMLASIGALFVLLLATDYAERDPSNATLLGCLALLFLGVPAIWTMLNLGLLTLRQQTGGQYVAALSVVRDDGAPLTLRTSLAWWFAGNPLLFSWPMIAVAGGPLLAAAALSPSDLTLAIPLLVIALAALLPVVALVSALVDRQHRALHDRIAGVTVVPAG